MKEDLKTFGLDASSGRNEGNSTCRRSEPKAASIARPDQRKICNILARLTASAGCGL
jgi:hypothetical protein